MTKFKKTNIICIALSCSFLIAACSGHFGKITDTGKGIETSEIDETDNSGEIFSTEGTIIDENGTRVYVPDEYHNTNNIVVEDNRPPEEYVPPVIDPVKAKNAIDNFNVDEYSILMTGLTMMTHYGLEYGVHDTELNDEQYDKIRAAIITNSWYSPFYEAGFYPAGFYDENTLTRDNFLTNDDVSRMVSVLMDRNMICTSFPDNISGDFASPQLFDYKYENVQKTVLDDYCIELDYNLMYYRTCFDCVYGNIKVKTILKYNPDSPLDNFSVIALEHELISKPVADSDRF